MADRATIAHLLRRAGFGPTAAEVDQATAAGYDATVDKLLDFSGPDPADALLPPTFAVTLPMVAQGLGIADKASLRQARATDFRDLVHWWLSRMVATAHPLREKLTFFWHGHFATSFDKVNYADLMYRQNQLLRTLGGGDFETLTQAVAKDPAMMIWLDTRSDKAAHPNENFARELMELFTLGIGNYSETDVREAARAFTGWVLRPATETWALQPRQHDNGVKQFLGHRGNLGGEDVIHILAGHPAGHAFVVSRVWSHFAYPVTAADPVVRDLVPGYAADRNIANLMRAVFHHPQFVSARARAGLVHQPVEWTIGAVRALNLSVTDQLANQLNQLGQVPFRPPSVGGWPQNGYWLTTAASLARFEMATKVAHAADLSGVANAAPSTRTAAVGQLLSRTWSATTSQALSRVASDPPLLVSLALVAPESVLA